MNHEFSQPIYFDDTSIRHFIRVVEESIGMAWIDKKIEEAKRRLQTKDLHTFAFAYQQPKHPLIDLLIQHRQWQQPEVTLELAFLGKHLEQVRGHHNFHELVHRLMGNEFQSTKFEIEVASRYLARNLDVEFVEKNPGTGIKTPDLKIMRKDGFTFWVECKSKELLTEHDKLIDAIWGELESSLLRYLVVRSDCFWRDASVNLG